MSSTERNKQQTMSIHSYGENLMAAAKHKLNKTLQST